MGPALATQRHTVEEASKESTGTVDTRLAVESQTTLVDAVGKEASDATLVGEVGWAIRW